MSDLLTVAHNRLPSSLELLRTLVEHESPTSDKAAVDTLGGFLVGHLQKLGAQVDVLAQPQIGDHVRATWAGGDPTLEPVLILTHMDTVWPVGELMRQPFRIEDDRCYGPGVFDMKAGIVIALLALEALADAGRRPRRPVTLLVTSDEETGSLGSRPYIEQAAQSSRCALILEPGNPGTGALKTSRKGVGLFSIRVRGRAAHAGGQPERGISAIEELARQIQRLHAMTDLAAGLTVNVGVVQGGTRSNVIAEEAVAEVDLRVTSIEQARQAEAAIHGLTAQLPGATVEVSGGLNRPPMVRTPAGGELFEQARSVAAAMGIALTEGASGGGSDGNFTAALGVPTLDGLGACGDGAHAVGEHILVSSLPERAAVLAGLLESL